MVWGLICIIAGFALLVIEHIEWYQNSPISVDRGLRTSLISGISIAVGIVIVCLKFEGII